MGAASAGGGAPASCANCGAFSVTSARVKRAPQLAQKEAPGGFSDWQALQRIRWGTRGQLPAVGLAPRVAAAWRRVSPGN